MIVLAARTLTEILVSLASNIFVLLFSLAVLIYFIGGFFLLGKFLFLQMFNDSTKKVQLEGDSWFWFAWVCWTFLLLCYWLT